MGYTPPEDVVGQVTSKAGRKAKFFLDPEQAKWIVARLEKYSGEFEIPTAEALKTFNSGDKARKNFPQRSLRLALVNAGLKDVDVRGVAGGTKAAFERKANPLASGNPSPGGQKKARK